MTRLGVLLLLALTLAGCAGASSPAANTAPTTRPFSLAEELKTVDPAAPAPMAGPLAIFGGDGTYMVGTDILAGTYRTQGPAYEGGTCYWSRLSDTTGDFDAIIANGSSRGPVTLTVKDSDAAVMTSGCTGWAKVDWPDR